MHRLILCAPLLCLACCAESPAPAQPPTTDSAATLHADAVIFPAELGEQVRWLGYARATGYWTPTPADVEPFETGLRALLEEAAAHPGEIDPAAVAGPGHDEWVRGELEQVLARLDDYRRQYVGVIDESGNRQILLRAFAGPAFDGGFDFPNWRRELAIVSDGGFWYWYAVYDPQTKRLVHLCSNGYA